MRNRIINPDPDRVILTQSLDEELPIFIVFRTVEHFMCLQEARGWYSDHETRVLSF